MRLKLQEEALKRNHYNAPKEDSDSSFDLKSFREANEKKIQYFFEEVQKLTSRCSYAFRAERGRIWFFT